MPPFDLGTAALLPTLVLNTGLLLLTTEITSQKVHAVAAGPPARGQSCTPVGQIRFEY